MNYSDADIEALIKGIFDGTVTPYDLPEDLYHAIGEHLFKGAQEGYGGDIADFEGTDKDLIESLQTNTYMFSAAKVFQQVSDMTDALDKLNKGLTKDGDITPWHEFKKQALEVYDQYNVDWLKTEYSTAIGQAQNAERWTQIESQKKTLPYLKYSAVEDSDECDICEPLNDVTLPVDDPFWDEFMPLNHFNCRCTVIQLDGLDDDFKTTSEGETEKLTKDIGGKMSDAFKMNAGKDGYIFSPDHPYFNVAKKDQGFADDNFGLPLPKK